MVKRKKDPSKAAKSAASIKGNAGPGIENEYGPNKVNSQNNQYKRITE
nr:YuzL family protein [uncultured Bacillus sp.]